MAIINSTAVGKARGSIGNVTMRTIRGRVIGSARIQSGVSTRGQSDAQKQQQKVFSLSSRYISLHKDDIGVSFDRSKYGTPRNQFYRLNGAHLAKAFSSLLSGEDMRAVSDDQVESAVTSYAGKTPNSIYRVRRSGYATVFLSGEWSSEDNPVELPDTPGDGGGVIDPLA